MRRDNGASVRIYNLAKGLSSLRNEVEIVLPTKDSYLRQVDGLTIHGIRGFLPNAVLNVLRKLIGVTRSTSLYFYDFFFIVKCSHFLKQADVVQIEQQTAGALFIPFIKVVLKKPVLIDCHDIFQALRVKHTGFLRKCLETFLEKFAYKTANFVLTVSEKEKNFLISYGVNKNKIGVVQNGVDTNLFSNHRKTTDTRDKFSFGNSKLVIFVGNMEYLPNREAVELLSSTIVPQVISEVQNVKFVVVGKTTGMVRPNNLIFTGKVDSVPEILGIADVAVAPLCYGSGTRLKIIEYLSSGLPVVSTSIGAEGLDVTNGINILIENDLNRFSLAIIRLLTDKDLSARIGQAARDVAINVYDWQISSEKLTNILGLVLQKS
jgi:glycosyltransferase involved in cell wall biosynthesis